jgi:phosphoribosylformylglycinamidine synthase
MQIYLGKNAYSSFRKKKLLSNLQKKRPLLRSFSANYVYFLNAENSSLEDQTKFIEVVDPQAKLLQPEAFKNCIWVTPRFGTISPWASKALDILHVCGLGNIAGVERGVLFQLEEPESPEFTTILPFLHDRMTQTVSYDLAQLTGLFSHNTSTRSLTIDVLTKGQKALEAANIEHGLALSTNDVSYLIEQYQLLGRNPTISELMMFAQINSEHCRHKIFNAQWSIDGEPQKRSLFGMIRNTHELMSHDVLSAYEDNAAVLAGHRAEHFFIEPTTHHYQYQVEPLHIVIKVETHNHPTAIAPFEGAATGAGGEIRDEGATGTGAKPKAGLVGFTVSNLQIPLLPQPWEKSIGYPDHIATALDIMLQAPIGAASFNNEFGRPNLLGYFRTFEVISHYDGNQIFVRGYHKPIMLAGGLGQIRSESVAKKLLPVGAQLIVLGGPAMLIGLGGGAASSLSSGASHEELDFASVQRSNPEIQRRAQEVINTCWSMGTQNPIISIHDVGAGGLSNALPELVHDSKRGAVFNLRAIHAADSSLSAMAIWCNEAQERYVLAINPGDLATFEKIAQRERCPFAVVGEVNDSQVLEVFDEQFNEFPVQVPSHLLFGAAAKMQRNIKNDEVPFPYKQSDIIAPPIDKARYHGILPLNELAKRVLQLPSVADKSFLITIGDRSVTGLVARDQMIGPWQVPVSDVAVTATSFTSETGEAMALGERTPLALLDAAASARMAVGEAITNIVAADVASLSDIKLSANWMSAINYPGEDANLYEAVQAVAMELCPELGICIPVGKDSLSMQMKWQAEDFNYQVCAPLSLIISAFAPVSDIRKTLTPELKNSPSRLLLLDLGRGKNRMGGSAVGQVTQQLGDVPPDLDDSTLLKSFFRVMQQLRNEQLVLAYHDRSDGGLFATICEMSFAAHLGVSLEMKPLGEDYISALFNEELGAVLQYPITNESELLKVLKDNGLEDCSYIIGELNDNDKIEINWDGNILLDEPRIFLHRLWSQTSYHLQSLRDNPLCAQQEYDALLDTNNPGLNAQLSFETPVAFPAVLTAQPKIAILREQGVNGHYEMAAAFERVGFLPVDVHMSDILNQKINLEEFQGLVACGGFSYGDVLGAGRGWANSILFNPEARDQFLKFFNMNDKFVLGVCNGCQMLSQLQSLIPGSDHWPTFARNQSEQFEARLSLVKVRQSPSIFFQEMEDSVIPIIVSHGEGQACFKNHEDQNLLLEDNLVPLQYVNNYGDITDQYPANPNGSVQGITALTNQDGRVTLMMPHPERGFRTVQFSWYPADWHPEYSPWIKMFANARKWLE